jgi:tetratricopeptide (TPR) repeat protein
MKYESSNKAIPEIAQELNVDGIVEASFSVLGENINIQVRLIRAHPEERQIWRQVYDRAMKNVLSVYGDAAIAIALAANIPLSSEEEYFLSNAREINPDAYEAYLRGMSYWELGTKADLDKAMNYFERARDIDPDYALAYLGISRTWGGYMQHGFMSADEVAHKSNEARKKALELDSNLVEIRAGMATRYTWGYWDWERAGKEFRIALEINPNYAFAHAYYSHYLSYIGQSEKGLIHGEQAIKLDPFNTLYQSVHGMALKNARKYDEALTLLEKLYRSEPDQGIGLPALWAVYHELGRYDDALLIAKKIYTLKGIDGAIEAQETGNNDVGYKMAMQRTAEMMIARSDTTYVTPWQICTLYCRAEMKDEALNWLENAYNAHDSNMPYISVDPLFDFLREEERFTIIMKQMNFPESGLQGK